ncbi:MAG TPA: hypothetical protein VL403_01425 [Candidatus Kryptonia bacterium]|nr:hypothetical protein [Candidatus Kryptonia bacterium]
MRTKSEVYDSVSRWLSAGVLLAALCLYPFVSVADVLWSWSFDTESGTFVTNGTFDQTSGAAVFTFKSFSVSMSQTASNVGASYNEGNQPVQTMSWNGSQPTQFTRANGFFTNGSNFYNVNNNHWYSLDAPNALMHVVPGTTLASGALTVVPLGEVIPQGVALAPAASANGIAFLTGFMLLVGVLSLRQRQQKHAAGSCATATRRRPSPN